MPNSTLPPRLILAEQIKARILAGEQVPPEDLKAFLVLARSDSENTRASRVKRENTTEKPDIDFF